MENTLIRHGLRALDRDGTEPRGNLVGIAAAARAYQRGASSYERDAEHAVSVGTIRHLIREEGVMLRPQGRRTSGS